MASLVSILSSVVPSSLSLSSSIKQYSSSKRSIVNPNVQSSLVTKRASSTFVVASASTSVSQSEIESLSAKFSAEGVTVDLGLGDLPRVILSTNSGSVVEVYLYGACATSWKLPCGEDLLYVRPDAVFTGQKPISGGIPHCFPQFGPGVMQQHGFARNLSWELVSSTGGNSPSISLRLSASDYTRAMWDYSFEATYKITLDDVTHVLSTELTVENKESEGSFEFTSALHSYFSAVAATATVEGLKGLDYLNKDPDPTNPIPGVEDRAEVGFPAFVDCMYLNAPSTLTLFNGKRKIQLGNSNWTDAVIWNPHQTMEACYKEFVCVENAKLSPQSVAAGEKWTAQTTMTPL